MLAKTFQGLEEVLAEELRGLGAINVEPGLRSVSFEGDLAMLYRANMCCRTALRILKPFYKFRAQNPDELYERVKDWDWSTLLSPDKTFSIDTVSFSDEFTHSRFVTYRVKDAIVDYFKDRFGPTVRPGVRVQDADVIINVHIAGHDVTLSLDSSGESLHKRGYRVAQTEAPINEVLAAGIILLSGWRGDCPLVDPMCGSGTFLIEGALIGAGINPGIFRRNFAFERWPDFNEELFESIYEDDSRERPFTQKIIGTDISPQAIAVARQNIERAGVGKYIDLDVRPIGSWTEKEVPAGGVIVTNPPYGERISVPDMEGLYRTIGRQLKTVFKGYHAWIIGYQDEYFHHIGLAPSAKLKLFNGGLECELREYEIFEGDYASFRREGNALNKKHFERSRPAKSAKREKAPDERYRPKKGPHADKPTRNRDSSTDRGWRKPFDRQRDSKEAKPAKRGDILDTITNRQPSLPPNMRQRRGWRKPPEAPTSNTDDNNNPENP